MRERDKLSYLRKEGRSKKAKLLKNILFIWHSLIRKDW